MSTENNNKDRSGSISERTSEFATKLISPKLLMMAGLAASGVLIIEGIICFSVCLLNIRSYILSFYYIVFGCLTIAAELKFKFIRKKLMLISMNTGRGFWYFFLGTLSLGGEWWSIVAAVILMILGILNVCAGFLNKSEQDAQDQRLSDQDEYQQHRPSFQQTVQITKAVSQNVDALHKAYDPPHQMVQNQLNHQQKQNAYDDY